MFSLSIIIVSWNTKALLEKCLLSVEDSAYDLNYELFVVDNGSTDGSQEMVRELFPKTILIENRENVGFACANNQAIRISHGSYILLLNSDAFISHYSLQKMIQVIEGDKTIGIAGACLAYPNGRKQVSHGPLPSYWSEVFSLFGLDKILKTPKYQQEYIETGVVSGACMLIRKSILDQIGLFDEGFFMFSEEVDLCKRCHNAGAKVVFIQSAKAIHVEAGSTGQTVHRIIQLYSGKLHYFYKHYGLNTRTILRNTMVITSTIKYVVYGLIRVFSFGQIKKDIFWLSVIKRLIPFPK